MRIFIITFLLPAAIFLFQNCGIYLPASKKGHSSLSSSTTPSNDPSQSNEETSKPPIVHLKSSFATITNLNRTDRTPPGLMFGGWGPQLRSIMRNQEEDLIFAAETGGDVLNSSTINYYRQVKGETDWSLIGSVNQLPFIQQNGAHLMAQNRFVYSFGLQSTGSRNLQQCYFDTISVNPQPPACNTMTVNGTPVVVAPGSNYIGATRDVDGSNHMIVWWTTVAVNSGTWSYIYTDNGFDWIGPITVGLGYTDFSYVAGALKGNQFIGAGQLVAGDYTSTYSYQGALADFTLGQTPRVRPLNFSSQEEPDLRVLGSTSDIVFDSNDSIHIIASLGAPPYTSPNKGLAYFHIESLSSLSSVPSSDNYFPGESIGRFHIASMPNSQSSPSMTTPAEIDGVSLLSFDPGKQSLTLRTLGNGLPPGGESPAVDFPPTEITYDFNSLGRISAIYTESQRHQQMSVGLPLEFGLVGEFSASLDHNVIQLRLEPIFSSEQ